MEKRVMLSVADYRVDGLKLVVRLKCTCGGNRIVKETKDKIDYYKCAHCGAKATMQELKREATTYWQGRLWEIKCEEPKKTDSQIRIQYPATLSAHAHLYAPAYCTLKGHCAELGMSGLLFVAQNFQRAYFEAMSTDHREAIVDFVPPVKGLLPKLHGSIVEIRFREEELPICHIRVAFTKLLAPEQKVIGEHVEKLRGRVTEWSTD